MNTLRKYFGAVVSATVAAVFVTTIVWGQNLNQPGGQLNNLNVPSAFQGGTWLPQLATSGSATSLSMSSQAGSYEIIGRQVSIRFNGASSTSTAGMTTTDILTITGLPIAAGTSTGDYGVCDVDVFSGVKVATGYGGIAGVITPGASTIMITQAGSNKPWQAIQAANIDNTGGTLTLIGKCVYHSP